MAYGVASMGCNCGQYETRTLAMCLKHQERKTNNQAEHPALSFAPSQQRQPALKLSSGPGSFAWMTKVSTEGDNAPKTNTSKCAFGRERVSPALPRRMHLAAPQFCAKRSWEVLPMERPRRQARRYGPRNSRPEARRAPRSCLSAAIA